MEFEGFVIHHTVCEREPRNWDFKIHPDGSVSSSSVLVHPGQIHICLEGDFNTGYESMSLDQKHSCLPPAKSFWSYPDSMIFPRYTCFLTPTPALGHIFHGTRL